MGIDPRAAEAYEKHASDLIAFATVLYLLTVGGGATGGWRPSG